MILAHRTLYWSDDTVCVVIVNVLKTGHWKQTKTGWTKQKTKRRFIYSLILNLFIRKYFVCQTLNPPNSQTKRQTTCFSYLHKVNHWIIAYNLEHVVCFTPWKEKQPHSNAKINTENDWHLQLWSQGASNFVFFLMTNRINWEKKTSKGNRQRFRPEALSQRSFWPNQSLNKIRRRISAFYDHML